MLTMSPCGEPPSLTSNNFFELIVPSFPAYHFQGHRWLAERRLQRTADVSACNDINNGLFFFFFSPFFPLLVSTCFVLLGGSLTLPQSSRGEKSPSWRPSGGSCFKKCKMSTGAESEERARWIFHCSICSAFAIVGVQRPSRRCTGLPASVQMSHNWILYPLNVNKRLFVLIKERALGGKRESVWWNLTFWNIKGPILWKIHWLSTGNMCLWHVGELSRN